MSRHIVQSIHSFPLDESPYGVRGMGGNLRDWCAHHFRPDGLPPGPSHRPRRDSGEEPMLVSATGSDGAVRLVRSERDWHVGETNMAPRVTRGGSWDSPGRSARVAGRRVADLTQGYANLGFRLVCDIDSFRDIEE